MSVATVYGRTRFGLDSPLITVEVHLSSGLPAFNIVGLPETAVRESKDRVRSALSNTNFEFPMRRITVNLAPADVPKHGCRFDLAIAIGILVANGDLQQDQVDNIEFIAELGLSGQLRPVDGILSSILHCEKAGHAFIGCKDNCAEISYESSVPLYFMQDLREVYQHLSQMQLSKPYAYISETPTNSGNDNNESIKNKDIAEVKGQILAKKALLIAAAGRHNILFFGPPGSGKTMLASRIDTILPDLSKEQALATATIYSCADEKRNAAQWLRPPLRTPHHSASPVAIVGGGRLPNPGEISLAHNGVLLLDEMGEFNKQVLEHLREPLESKQISISRAQWKVTFPADIQLLATMNPCPCGYRFSNKKECRCNPESIQRYQAKISGPIKDRIDIFVFVDNIPMHELVALKANDDSADKNDNQHTTLNSENMLKMVENARARQLKRQQCFNANLSNTQVDAFCQLTKDADALLIQSLEALSISTRVYYRLLKLARTIADISAAETIDVQHIGSAINFRKFML